MKRVMRRIAYIGVSVLTILTMSGPAFAEGAGASARPGMFSSHGRPGRVSGTTANTSTNWSGYAATGGNGSFNAVTASWTQPTVNCTNVTTNTYSAYWVGLDGFSSPTVEQIGTEADCSRTHVATYGAWYEMYPANPYEVRLGLAIHAGDQLAASVKFTPSSTTTAIVRGRPRTTTTPASYTVSLANNTTGKSFSTSVSPRQTYARSSAEVVTEAPYSSGILPLANYGTVSYTNSTANSTPLGGLSSLQSIAMQNPNSMYSTPSLFDSTNTAFSTTWSATSP